MLRFLILMFGLFLPTLAFADGLKEPVYPPYCWIQPTGSTLWYPCGSEEAFNANCVQRMEFAMHQADQFVTSGSKIPDAVLKSWTRAKHDCWKEYEQERLHHIH